MGAPFVLFLSIILLFFRRHDSLDEDSNVFEVVVPSHEQVGLVLGREKEVRTIVGAEESWIYTRGGVRVGDFLLKVNGIELKNLAMRDVPEVVNNATLPKVFSFLPFDGQQRHVANMYSPLTLGEHVQETVPVATPHMDLSVGPQSLGTLEVVNSLFGTDAPCRSFKVIFAEPRDACSSLDIKVKGMYVLVKRGGCSFSAKAEIVQTAQAKGMILVNSRHAGPEFPMQLDQAHAPGSITIPAVMISKESALEIKHLMQHHKYHSGVKARLVTTKECYRGDKLWHSEHHMADHLDDEAEQKLQAGKRDAQRIHSAKGMVTIKIMIDEDEDPEPFISEKPDSEISLAEKAALMREAQGFGGGFIEFDGNTAARCEFLTTNIGGPIILNEPFSIFAISPEADCKTISESLQVTNSLVVLGPYLSNVGCGFAETLTIMEHKGAAGVAFVGEELLIPIDFDGKSNGMVDGMELTLGVIILSRKEGEALISKIHTIFPQKAKGEHQPEHHSMVHLRESAEIHRNWVSLAEVSDTSKWPTAGPKRKIVYNRIKKKHDPSSSSTGSYFRLEILTSIYENTLHPNPKEEL